MSEKIIKSTCTTTTIGMELVKLAGCHLVGGEKRDCAILGHSASAHSVLQNVDVFVDDAGNGIWPRPPAPRPALCPPTPRHAPAGTRASIDTANNDAATVHL